MGWKYRSLLLITGLAAFCAATTPAMAAWPERPVHILVTTAPGGGADTMARLIGGKLAEKWGQTVLIENRPGGDGLIAYNAVAHAPPDGYTLGWLVQSFSVLPSQHDVLPYDPVKDFTPISLLLKQPQILLVSGTSPINTAKDLIALAKSKPGGLNYGSSGLGSSQFMDMERFKKMTGTDLVHIAYQGGAGPAQTALLGGEIQALFQPISTVLEQIKGGRMKGLAVTSEKRHPALPDIPTVAEATGFTGLENGGGWYGITGPGRMSSEIVTRLHEDIKAMLATPEVRRVIDPQGLLVVMNSPAEFAELLRSDIPKQAEIMKSIGTK